MKIKICCISSLREADLAIQAGADTIGLVGRMPSGPGVIDFNLIKKIAVHARGKVETTLLTSATNWQYIIAECQEAGVDTVQIVDTPEPGSYDEIRKALPGMRIVQVLHVRGQDELSMAAELEQKVDAILLDSGNPAGKVKTLGGTGHTHNWSWSQKIVKAVSIPVYLAGGLNPANIHLAIQMVTPFGIDVCSGVRSNGILNEKKLMDFIANARQAGSTQ